VRRRGAGGVIPTLIISNWELRLRWQWRLECRQAERGRGDAAAAQPLLCAPSPGSLLLQQLAQGLAFTLGYAWFTYTMADHLTPAACGAA
jgi:hypothetical protein